VETDSVWLPAAGVGVFDEFPSHPRTSQQTQHSTSLPHREKRTDTKGQPGSSASIAPQSVIDGQPTALAQGKEKKHELVPGQKWLERIDSFPPLESNRALSPKTVVKDWRFGRISIETVDLACMGDMAGETSRAGALAAPTLGPTFGGAGTATKASFMPLKTINTNVGWGVVHFYREGEDTPGLGQLADDNEHGEPSDPSTDCTTLCIPAVPAYISPEDFLGFIGERWRSDISHCRMVMTTQMSIYLVLLKFRNSNRAKEWRKEFNGKVFNTMEASSQAAIP
jgi:BRCA1-associated protein